MAIRRGFLDKLKSIVKNQGPKKGAVSVPKARNIYVRLHGDSVYVALRGQQGVPLGNPEHVGQDPSLSQAQKPEFDHSHVSQDEWVLARKIAEKKIK